MTFGPLTHYLPVGTLVPACGRKSVRYPLHVTTSRTEVSCENCLTSHAYRESKPRIFTLRVGQMCDPVSYTAVVEADTAEHAAVILSTHFECHSFNSGLLWQGIGPGDPGAPITDVIIWRRQPHQASSSAVISVTVHISPACITSECVISES